MKPEERIVGKKLSLISKGVAIGFAIVAFLVFKMAANEIVIIGVFIAGAFIPVDASMILKNVKGK